MRSLILHPVHRLRSLAMGTTLAAAAHKGGAGKTLLVANLAGALAADGARVQAIDADPQGALAAALGIRPTKPTLYEVLDGRATAADAIEIIAPTHVRHRPRTPR
jgi:cellulose biosynthesis protein BcsQ